MAYFRSFEKKSETSAPHWSARMPERTSVLGCSRLLGAECGCCAAAGCGVADGCMKEVKKDGVITVEEAKGTETTMKVVKGMQFDRGYVSAYFMLFFLWDPMQPQPHDVDVRSLLRIANLYNIPTACNRATADFLISSSLLTEDYDKKVKDYSEYLNRKI